MSELSDTAKLILAIYGDSNIRRNQGFKVMDLILHKTLLSTHHQEKFSVAVYQLIALGYLEWGDEYVLLLTDKGYKSLNN